MKQTIAEIAAEAGRASNHSHMISRATPLGTADRRFSEPIPCDGGGDGVRGTVQRRGT